MANSATEICNLSLDLLSSDVVQNVVDPTNPTEEILKRWYDKSRRKALRSHPWNFAIKRVILSPSSTDPEFGWTYKFQTPSDFIRIATLEGSDGRQIWKDEYEFESNHILYNDSTINLRYIYDLEDVTKFDELFTDLLVCEIALGISYKATGSNSDVDRLLKLRNDIKMEAKAIDGQERPPLRVEKSKIMNARRVSSKRADII